MMQLAYIRHVDTIPSTLRHVQPTRHVQQRPFARSSLCWHRPHRLHSLSRESALVCRATSAPDELVVLPVFTGSSILLPTGNGVLRAYEKRYTDLFRSFQRQLEVDSSDPPRFLHLISPATAPPAMVFDSPIKDFPNVGCCAYVENVESLEDGSLIVRYRGHRRVLLHLIEEKSNEEEFISTSLSDDEKLQIAAGVWYDDDEEILQENDAVAGLAALERDVAAVIKEIVRLTRITDPSNSNIPEAVLKYAPPAPGRTGRPTSYDALKASGHKAASAIDMWRRHAVGWLLLGGSRRAGARNCSLLLGFVAPCLLDYSSAL